MTCHHPLKAYRSGDQTSTGKRKLTFNPHKSYVEGSSLSVPCGQCIGCRVDRARDWATRCQHEAKLWDSNLFLTLTYDDKYFPENGSVDLRTLQLFLKRLREWYEPARMRFFACGEYSPPNPQDPTRGNRPHYHLLCFNLKFPDLKKWKQERSYTVFRSATLESLWTYGFSTIGQVNYTTANYVAQYTMKKVTGDRAVDHYTRPHPLTGKIVTVQPEFLTMSRRPGIGSGWYEKFKGDAFPSDFLIVDGRKTAVPRYYDNKLKAEAESDLEKIKRRRKAASNKHRADQTPARLRVREEVLAARLSRKKRLLGDYS